MNDAKIQKFSISSTLLENFINFANKMIVYGNNARMNFLFYLASIFGICGIKIINLNMFNTSF